MANLPPYGALFVHAENRCIIDDDLLGLQHTVDELRPDELAHADG